MPAQKKTTLGLNQWIGSEYPKRIDFVEDNKIINDELENRVKYTDLAEENKAGIITYAKIKEIAPRPDLSPYIPFSKGYRDSARDNFVIRANNADTWIPQTLNMYNPSGSFIGAYHTNGGRAYYKVPNRNNGNWCEIMDQFDMTTRDNRMNAMDSRMNSMDSDRNSIRSSVSQLWGVANDDTVRDIRMVGFIVERGPNERQGYVVTYANDLGNNTIQYARRALQVRRGVGGNKWYNVPFG